MIRIGARKRVGLAVVACALFGLLTGVLATSAAGDVIRMKDGRVFEGRVLEYTVERVTVDAMVAGLRTTLELDREQIANVRFEAVPDSFYEPAKGDEAGPMQHEGTPYLHVPLQGTLGEQVLPAGLKQALFFCERMNIRHVVISIDSDGGDVQAALALRNLIRDYATRLEIHGVVEYATGEALLLPFACEGIFIASDAQIGRLDLTTVKLSDHTQTPEMARDSALARAMSWTSKTSVADEVFAAMLVPDRTVAAWTDGQGNVQIAEALPGDVPQQRVLFVDDDDTLLVLTGEQAAAIGMGKAFEGDAAKLGEALGIADWKAYSIFGETAMIGAVRRAEEAADRAAQKEAIRQRKIDENIASFQRALQYVWANLQEYDQYKPEDGEYFTYQGGYYRTYDYYNYGFGNNYYYEPYDTNLLTKYSRQKWRNRTDLSVAALERVREGLRVLDRLARKGKYLGIQRDADALIKDYIAQASGEQVYVGPENIYSWAGREIDRMQKQRNRRYR